ncbi:MAG: hypothetical protein K8S27_15870, partial [Candidatus Omnitrophica bacterium]|nr:hypothetical protein [Candidatus Omnitrophota bacterium]
KDDENILRRLLHGLSTHKYHESASLAAKSFGISASNLSKRFPSPESAIIFPMITLIFGIDY